MQQQLEKLGYTVQLAGNAEMALQLLASGDFRPDLGLTDMIMPGINGNELIKRVHRDYPDIRFLCMSGYLGDIEKNASPLDPELVSLQKPFTKAALVEALGRVLT